MEEDPIASPFVVVGAAAGLFALTAGLGLAVGGVAELAAADWDPEWGWVDRELAWVSTSVGLLLKSWAFTLWFGLGGPHRRRPWAGALLTIVAALSLGAGTILLPVSPGAALIPLASGGVIWMGVRAESRA